MKITPEWLAATPHCPDGRAFGEAMLPPEGLDLERCWILIDRPDWVISLAVKTKTLSYKQALSIVFRALRGYAADVADKAALRALEDFEAARVEDLLAMRADLAAMAYTAVANRGDLPASHRFGAIGQLVTAQQAALRDRDLALALERLQGAAFSFGLAIGQFNAAKILKDAMSEILKRGQNAQPV